MKMNNEIKTFTPLYTSAYALNEGFCAYAISLKNACAALFPCTNPEGGQGVRTPGKITKNIGFLSNTGLDPLKNHKATKSAIIGTPAKCHLGR